MVKEGATGNLITKAKTRRENTKFSQGVKNTFLKTKVVFTFKKLL